MVNNKKSSVLIITNLIILLISIFLGLDTYEILLIFWLESAVITLFFALRLPFIFGILSFILIAPFIVYTAIFMLVHLMFLGLFFSKISDPQLIEVARQSVGIFYNYWYAILILLLNYGFYFLFNFIKNKEYFVYRESKEKFIGLLLGIYKRMFFMHFSMVVMGFLGVFLSFNSVLIVLIIIIFKTIFDLKSDMLNNIVLNNNKDNDFHPKSKIKFL